MFVIEIAWIGRERDRFGVGWRARRIDYHLALFAPTVGGPSLRLAVRLCARLVAPRWRAQGQAAARA